MGLKMTGEIPIDADKEFRKECVMHIKIKKMHRFLFRLKLLMFGLTVLSCMTGFGLEVDYAPEETPA